MALKGRVKLFLPGKSYGFVAPDDGSKDVYFVKKVVEGQVDLKEGQAVEYRLGTATRIPQADWVKPV
ncbi:MAG: cold shock domain-containing protein [Candidatus Riflebacteria bacterium]|nr:cold shock domain-containing protein [Candidatus Riflebacteria bacterium]